MRAKLPSWLLLIGAMTAVGPVTIDMYLPGFPAIEGEFGEQGVEKTMSAYLIGIALGQLFYGPISDRFGRKPPLYAGFLLYALGSLGCMAAASMSMLMGMRFLQALGACGGMVIGRAIIRDRCEPQEAARAFSLLMAIVSLGPILAPSAGGLIVTAFGWRGVFVFQVLFGLGLLIAMHLVLTESRDPATVKPISVTAVAVDYHSLMRDRAFVGYTLVGAFGVAALFVYVTGAPAVLIEGYGLSAQQFGGLLAANGLAFMAASRINIVALRKRTPAQLLARNAWIPAFVGAALVVCTLVFHVPLWLFVVVQLLFFVSIARVTPHSAALSLAPYAHIAGSASAMMGALQSVIPMMVGFALAVFNDGKPETLAIMMTIGALGVGISYECARRVPAATKAERE
jgi:DHA1 family bicyclomycin/chloramphenicol resistance-like MFS transporter